MKKLILVGAALIATVAFAVNVDIREIPMWIKGGVTIGKATAIGSSTHTIKGSYGAQMSYDFPACATSGFDAITACHKHTVSFPCPGGQIGDLCQVTSDHSIADGGLDDSVTFDCQVLSAGLCDIRLHYFATDAGVVDVVDSGYTVRLTSNLAQ